MTDKMADERWREIEESNDVRPIALFIECKRARASEVAKDAEIARLRAALKPFAEFVRLHVHFADSLGLRDTHAVALVGDGFHSERDAVVTVADCRAALKALEKP